MCARQYVRTCTMPCVHTCDCAIYTPLYFLQLLLHTCLVKVSKGFARLDLAFSQSSVCSSFSGFIQLCITVLPHALYHVCTVVKDFQQNLFSQGP